MVDVERPIQPIVGGATPGVVGLGCIRKAKARHAGIYLNPSTDDCPGLHSEFQARQSYIVRPYLKTK